MKKTLALALLIPMLAFGQKKPIPPPAMATPAQGGKVDPATPAKPEIIQPSQYQLKQIELAYRNLNEAQSFLGETIVAIRTQIGIGADYQFDPSRSAYVHVHPQPVQATPAAPAKPAATPPTQPATQIDPAAKTPTRHN